MRSGALEGMGIETVVGEFAANGKTRTFGWAAPIDWEIRSGGSNSSNRASGSWPRTRTPRSARRLRDGSRLRRARYALPASS